MSLKKLPFVYMNVATTADGKIAPMNRRFVPFSSRRDQELLLELRTHADAVMAGARTVDLYPVSLGPGPKKYRQRRLKQKRAEYNLRIVVSGSGSLNPKAKIFKKRFSPIIILTTETGKKRLVRNKVRADEIKVCGKKEINFRYALQWLRSKWNVKSLLCEGGGELNEALFKAKLVNEIFLTFCPVIFGGRQAPTMVDGQGFTSSKDAPRLKIKSLRRLGDELFLRYKVL
jgi:riboflavin-specific deaminase-like protein